MPYNFPAGQIIDPKKYLWCGGEIAEKQLTLQLQNCKQAKRDSDKENAKLAR